MDYEKLIKRLVLGYLKRVCKPAYNVFLNIHFRQNRHIATRVAGQSLEDILRTYSGIQDIVQGHLEETDYFQRNGVDKSSPIYLEEQLQYLLEHFRVSSPTSTNRERSVSRRSTVNSHDDSADAISDLDTTPENTLPGNVDERSRYLKKLPNSARKSITSVVSKKLLEKKEFPRKLAKNINTALKCPQVPETVRESESNNGFGLDDSIVQNAISRTEADPIFEDLLEQILGPLGNSSHQEITSVSDHGSSSTENHTSVLSTSSRNKAESSQQPLSIVPTSFPELNYTVSQPQSSAETNNLQPLGRNQSNFCETPTQSNTFVKPVSEQQLQPIATNVNPNAVSLLSPVTTCQPRYILYNQPILIAQPNPMILPSMSNISESMPKAQVNSLSEQDILSMPTIIVGDRNDVTCTDGAGRRCNTPRKQTEVQNLKDYYCMFSSVDKSPLVKAQQNTKKVLHPLKPVQSVKVEIFHNHTATLPTEGTLPVGTSQLKSLPIISAVPVPDETKSIDAELKKASAIKSKSASICTPSPLPIVVKKPTPQSGSHVRNLVFPSPIRKPESDGSAGSPSSLHKEQTSKDVFNAATQDENMDIENKEKTRKTPSKKKGNASSQKGQYSIWDQDVRSMLGNAERTPSSPVKRVKGKRGTCRKKTKIVQKGTRKSKEDTNNGEPKTLPQSKEETEVNDTNVEPKPQSNLCQAATTRPIVVDGKSNPSHPLISSARKNITTLLDTPSKSELVTTKCNISISPTESPITPMLKANLQGLVNGDTFAIDTPNFPITPGLSLMETNYCILKDTETNKATEAVVLFEERKSSVRKTDEEDMIVNSPRVYGCKDVLKNFNESRMGKKNLQLLDNKGVKWDESSKDDEKSETSSTDGDTNSTVIQNVCVTGRVTRSGKKMALLKAQVLKEETLAVVVEKPEIRRRQKKKTPVKSSPLARRKSKRYRNLFSTDSDVSPEKPISNETNSTTKTAEAHQNQKEKPMTRNKRRKTIVEQSPEMMDSTNVSSKEDESPESTKAKLTIPNSVKEELEQKRQRMIALEKNQTTKMPGRRKSTTQKSSSSKRKSLPPKKLVRSSDCVPEPISNDADKDISQDEFFQKIGSNLHRTNIRSETKLELNEEEKKPNDKENSKTGEIQQEKKEPNPEQVSAKLDQQEPSNDIESYWNESCSMISQTEEQIVIYNESNPPRQLPTKHDSSALNKSITMRIALDDGEFQSVRLQAMPFQTVFEMTSTIIGSEEPPVDNSDSDNAIIKAGDLVDVKWLKKRKHRSDSCSSNNSAKKMKATLPIAFNNIDIQTFLTKLHGPSDE